MAHSSGNYTAKDVETFVRLLGCWHHAAPYQQLPLRNPAEYRTLLKRLLEVYSGASGTMARLHRDAARRALRELEQ